MSGRIKLKSGVPIPPRKTKYPWADMAMGQSFSVTSKKSLHDRQVIMNSAASFAKEHNPNFYVTTKIEGEVITVWRITKNDSKSGRPRRKVPSHRLTTYIPKPLYEAVLKELKGGQDKVKHGALSEAVTEALETWLDT